MTQVWRRKLPRGFGLETALAATRTPGPAAAIPEADVADDDGFVLASWTVDDAWELGHLLHARLLPLAPARPALVSISVAGAVVFQAATGAVPPDTGAWVARKRNTAVRIGRSSWAVGRQYDGDAGAWAAKHGVPADEYAVHGGAVPVRVPGVDGVVGVVVVSGLTQGEDHGVVAEVIRKYWQPENAA